MNEEKDKVGRYRSADILSLGVIQGERGAYYMTYTFNGKDGVYKAAYKRDIATFRSELKKKANEIYKKRAKESAQRGKEASKEIAKKSVGIDLQITKDEELIDIYLRKGSNYEIIQFIINKYKIPIEHAYIYAAFFKKSLADAIFEKADDIIRVHISRYDKLYEWFYENGYEKKARAMLLLKEKLINVNNETIETKIKIRKESVLEIDTTKENEKTINKFYEILNKIYKIEDKKSLKVGWDRPKNGKIELNKNFITNLEKYTYRKSYYEFFKTAYKVLLSGEEYKDNWHIEVLCNVLQNEAVRISDQRAKDRDICINMPFRSAKSLVTTIIFPAWVWANVSANIKFICVSYSKDLALEHAVLCKDLVQSEWYQSLYPHIKLKEDQKSKGMFKLSGFSGYRKSVGTGGQITGSGADIIIGDDVQDPRRAASEIERKNAIKFWKETLASRLNQPDTGLKINIQQRLHEEDVTGYLMENQNTLYKFIVIPAKIERTEEGVETKPSPVSLEIFYKDNLFWKERFSEKALENFKIALGTYGYSGQLQQKPSPDEGGTFKRKWFDIIEPESITRDFNTEPIYFYIDTAETEKQKGDFTAILSCFYKNGNIYITNVVQVKKEFSELCKFIPVHCHRYQYTNNSRIKVEPKSSGKSVVSQLKDTTNLHIVELPAPKDDKLTRANSCQPTAESGRIKLIKGSWNQEFLDQVCVFPNGTNDDMLDTMLHAIEDILAPNNFDFTFI